MRRWLIFLLIWTLFPLSHASAIERRKEQFLKESSYLAVPLPYSFPGIGEGWMLIGLAGNMGGSYADLYGISLTGDATGTIFGLTDLHLISETLFVEFQGNRLDKAVVQIYNKRGMNTTKEEFNYVELNKVENDRAGLTLSLWDRRIEFSAIFNEQRIAITRMRDSDGNLTRDFDTPYKSTTKTYEYNAVLDYTDDRQDPLNGFRMILGQQRTPRSGSDAPEFFVNNVELQAYIPIGKQSTWAFNIMRSDAVVTSRGETNEDLVTQSLGIGCYTYSSCSSDQKALVDAVLAEHKYGSSTALGGDQLMRAYPMNRFQGAHTIYYSTELRWNFATDVTPFDFWIWKDVATGFQAALFYEAGAVSETADDLGAGMRYSYGAGLRMISASGYVYRADLANGDEGNTTVIMFEYPW